jgi:ADP-ribose pyrophosphatase
MSHTPDTPLDTLGTGRFLKLVRRGRWEFATRTKPVRAAFIGAVTDDDKILLTDEYREPVAAWVVGCPAGLIGDDGGVADESTESAVSRELVEEAGYEASDVRRVTAGPTSPGMTDEVIEIAIARGLKKVGAGGGVHGEQIRVFEVPLAEADAWLQQKERDGRLIDPKVYTVLYFLRCRPAGANLVE